MSALDIVGDDLKTELPSGETIRFAHLDYAASAPCVEAAAQAVGELLPRYGSVHRGTGVRSQTSTVAYEVARDVVAEFVGARPGDHVIFTRNTTDSLNLLARALPAGTTTILFDGEHHANLLPWPNPLRLPTPASPHFAVQALQNALRDLRTPAVLAITGASNVTGEIWPVRELADVAHTYGVRVVVDAAQLAPHRPVDLDELGADYLAFSGHKLYAPFGSGVLVGRGDWLDAADPYLYGGGASATVGERPGEQTWAAGPARHEGGTPNLLGATALAAVCAALLVADRDELHRHEQALLARLRAGLVAVPEVREVSIFGPEHPRVGIVSLVLPGHDPARVAHLLGREHGIGVRAGQFCAHPLVRRLTNTEKSDICGTNGAGLLRASFGLGSTVSDIDRFVTALADTVRS
ncbi:cysteine desulfurase [Actinoplanes sp. SE50]|uniref:aminotransferase class V-fold PLP-dependent enzyme n=1 Tax=unclassified Actinoplanes TaxID=2626549 RepID=UPI00023ECAD7|nr:MULTISPECIES: aminotransferase class V-fold PLP-dependent enzyme [unclassified Actinoplanes]AEV83178.1 cysteine desulfurase [Actinoplanes sp. SE50/110]ATO81571.1 cysteine desulfurase [Actinoplanes sp. SE50]SLL98979.1 cysteine desulfurase [Actinoplanes sp. SE50/110]